MNMQMYRGSLEGVHSSDKHLAHDVNLRRTLIAPRSLAVVAVLAAAARTLFARIARISIGSRLFGRRSDILAIFLPRSTERGRETNVREFEKQNTTNQHWRRDRTKIYLSKLSTCDDLNGFFSTGKPEFPHKFVLNSLNIFVRPNY
jgi:hypothetical protein